MRPVMLEIINTETDEQIEHAKRLFEEYAVSLGIDLSFQNFEKELADFPAGYVAPEGCLMIALYENQPAGCVALRRLNEEICEMKRLYVLPQFRKLKIGKMLAEAVIKEARKLQYKWMRLDTLPSMTQAQTLYKSLCFKEIAPYCFNPVEGTVFMALELGNW